MALTPRDIELVRKTWEPIARDLEGNGSYILKKFFDKHEQYYALFARFRDHPRDTIQDNPVFRNHAYKLAAAINDMVDALDDTTNLPGILATVAKTHARRKITVQPFKELQVVILDVLKKDFRINDEEYESWNKVITVAFALIAYQLPSN